MIPHPAHPGFSTAPAFADLRRLAERPFDLTAPGALSSQRLDTLRASALGFTLLYATQRVDPPALNALMRLAEQCGAQSQLAALMGGAVMNRIEGHESENRRVLHSACRDVFDDLPAPASAPAPSQAREEAKGQLVRLESFLHALERGEIRATDGGAFTDLLHIGIGGSDLGPRALFQALTPWRVQGRRVHFVSNVDPDDLAGMLRRIRPERTLVNIVSKSGGTAETRANETWARETWLRAGLDPARHFICVTGKGSPMDDPARYRAVFHMYDYVGGRYSATSMVGGVPLGFGLGLDNFLSLLRGAREMDLHALTATSERNLPLLLALLGLWNRNFLGLPTLAVLPYSRALTRFPAHLQQLDMESNGKSITRKGQPVAADTGPIVWGEPGTNGQHAFYQLIHQSRTVVPCEFIGFRKSQFGQDSPVDGTTGQQKLLANLLAQSLALATGQRSGNPNRNFPGNRPSSLLLADQLDPRTLGALLSLYENKVTFQGLIWDINSFDQEGVQLGKVLAERLLRHMGHKGATTASDALSPTELALLRAAELE
ncbi:MAG: glucose-6-phosphate isomerase [Deltaproteobacteria bacterium]|nr:glucose-6-phosphate isomerase [Deltaproteobacteria bacterium]